MNIYFAINVISYVYEGAPKYRGGSSDNNE